MLLQIHSCLGTGTLNIVFPSLNRALTTINYREESEKLNVWIAFLNLENAYGDPPKVLKQLDLPDNTLAQYWHNYL